MCGGDHPSSKRVKVICPDSTVIEFASVKDASNSLMYSSSTLAKMCRKNGTFVKGRLKGYSFTYTRDTP